MSWFGDRQISKFARWTAVQSMPVVFLVLLAPFLIWLAVAARFQSLSTILGVFCLWLASFVLTVAVNVTVIDRFVQKLLLRSDLSIAELRALRWREFEVFVRELYRLSGYEVDDFYDGGPDGGIDLWLRKDGTRYIVQCKHFSNEPIGVRPLRELYGVMIRKGADRCIFVTSSCFSQPAQSEFAGDPRIQLVDEAELMAMVRDVPPDPSGKSIQRDDPGSEQLRALIARVKELGDDWVRVPSCPTCSSRMVLRWGPTGAFWGCPRFGSQKCTGTRNLDRQDAEVLAPGHARPR